MSLLTDNEVNFLKKYLNYAYHAVIEIVPQEYNKPLRWNPEYLAMFKANNNKVDAFFEKNAERMIGTEHGIWDVVLALHVSDLGEYVTALGGYGLPSAREFHQHSNILFRKWDIYCTSLRIVKNSKIEMEIE